MQQLNASGVTFLQLNQYAKQNLPQWGSLMIYIICKNLSLPRWGKDGLYDNFLQTVYAAG